MEAFPPEAIRAACLEAAAPSLRLPRPLDGLCTLLEEAARRRLDTLPLAAGELLALTRHLRPRRVPSEAPPAAAVAARLVQMAAAELRELGRRWGERRAAEA